MTRPTITPARIRQLKAAGFTVQRESWEECGGDPAYPAGTIRHGWFYVGPGGGPNGGRGDIDYTSPRRAWDGASRDHRAPPWPGRARETWADTYRAARVASDVPPWVRACFPRGWLLEAATVRLGVRRIGLEAATHRAAVALWMAANSRQLGRSDAARMYLGLARRANAARHLSLSPAFGA